MISRSSYLRDLDLDVDAVVSAYLFKDLAYLSNLIYRSTGSGSKRLIWFVFFFLNFHYWIKILYGSRSRIGLLFLLIDLEFCDSVHIFHLDLYLMVCRS